MKIVTRVIKSKKLITGFLEQTLIRARNSELNYKILIYILSFRRRILEILYQFNYVSGIYTFQTDYFGTWLTKLQIISYLWSLRTKLNGERLDSKIL